MEVPVLAQVATLWWNPCHKYSDGDTVSDRDINKNSDNDDDRDGDRDLDCNRDRQSNRVRHNDNAFDIIIGGDTASSSAAILVHMLATAIHNGSANSKDDSSNHRLQDYDHNGEIYSRD